MHSMVLTSDTVGSICSRHGLSRERFFELNPLIAVESFYTPEGFQTAQLIEGDTVRIHLDEATAAQLRAMAAEAAKKQGESQGLDPQQQQALNVLADMVKEGKVSKDLGKKIAEEVGRAGAMAACVYFTGNPSLSFLCGEIGKKAGGTLWPLIKKGSSAVGSVVKKGGGYVYDKAGDALSSIGGGLKKGFYEEPKQLVGHMGSYVKCVVEKKDPFSCAKETGVNLVEGIYDNITNFGGDVVQFGKDAVCEVSGIFGADWLCGDNPPPAPPAPPQLPPEPTPTGSEAQFAADLIVYIKQFGGKMNPDRLVGLTNQLRIALSTSIVFCSKAVWAKLDQQTSDVCEESVMTVTDSAMQAILNDSSAANPEYALELAKSAKFGIAMEALPYVNNAGVDASTRIAALLLLSSKGNGAMSPQVGLALFSSLVANLFHFSCDDAQDCFKEFGVNDAVPMIWYGMLSNVDTKKMSALEAGNEAMRLFMSLLAQNMEPAQSKRIAQRLVASNEVPPEVAQDGLASGYTSNCGNDPNCKEEAQQRAQEIVATAESSSSSQGEEKKGLSGLAIFGLAALGVIGVGAAVRVSKDLPVLPQDWSHPLS